MFEMNEHEKKYNRILDLLKRSKPVLSLPGEIESTVMRRIIQKQEKRGSSVILLDHLFGWVYIGWVRSGLVAASVLLVAVFIYQQAVILKRINNLNDQAIYIENQMDTPSQGVPYESSFFRFAGESLPHTGISVSEKQIRKLIRSYNELEGKYKDLIRLIEEDPELKKYIEERLTENSRKKLNM